MRKSCFSEKRIIKILKAVEAGRTTRETIKPPSLSVTHHSCLPITTITSHLHLPPENKYFPFL